MPVACHRFSNIIPFPEISCTGFFFSYPVMRYAVAKKNPEPGLQSGLGICELQLTGLNPAS